MRRAAGQDQGPELGPGPEPGPGETRDGVSLCGLCLCGRACLAPQFRRSLGPGLDIGVHVRRFVACVARSRASFWLVPVRRAPL